MLRLPIVIAGVGTPELITSSLKAFGREQVLGLIDDSFETLPKVIFGIPVLGPWQWIANKQVLVINSVAKDSNKRKMAFEELLKYGAAFAEFPQIDVWESDIGTGSAILDQAFISTNVKLGKNVFLHNYSYVGHDCFVGDHSIVSVGATLLGNVKVSQECFIGARSTLIQGVKVGANSVVASGSVVYSDVPENHFCIGNPATSYERSDIVK